MEVKWYNRVDWAWFSFLVAMVLFGFTGDFAWVGGWVLTIVFLTIDLKTDLERRR